MLKTDFLSISIFLISIYSLINNFEWLTIISNRLYTSFFTEKAVFLRTQDRIGSRLPKNPRLSNFLSLDILPKILCLASILSGILLILSILFLASYSLSLVCIIFFSHLVFNTFYGFGLEGSDQMAIIVLFGIIAYLVIPESDTIIKVFITIQVILSYSVAGIAKIVSKEWRTGTALIKIISTKSFGLGKADFLSKNITLTKLLAWGVIAYEISWLLVPFDKSLCLIIVSAGVIFHLVNSYLMGLNLFKWSFVSAYPFVLSLFGYL